MKENRPIRNALISVYDKTGLPQLCRALDAFGIHIYATEGTGEFISRTCKVKTHKIEALTQFPELMEGRVKTLHPKVFGGILARRKVPGDIADAEKFEIPLFDLVVVNLYPYALHRHDALERQTTFIDIGGPSLIRAAAKNFESVVVLSDPSDYTPFMESLQSHRGSTTIDLRHALAAQAFSRTSRYDAQIAAQWTKENAFPEVLPLVPLRPLRYGENPHQRATWCYDGEESWKLLQGKELSYNNLLDANAALQLALEFETCAVAIVKHNNPCGVAIGPNLDDTFSLALSTDPKSSYGGIVALNRVVDAATATAMSRVFLEVVVAWGFSEDALKVFSAKKNLRLIQWEKPESAKFEVRHALGGWLVQSADPIKQTVDLRTVSKAPLTAQLQNDLQFAWTVAKHVRSNAIVIAKEGGTVGIGAGQMSRVDAVELALHKSDKTRLKGAVLASDAFFPFRDNIDLLKGTGIAAVIQPGGSQRDPEVIQACDELGIAMAFTGQRHFKH